MIGRIALRSGIRLDRLLGVIRQHWAGSAEIDPTEVAAGSLALQSGATDRLGFVARELGDWIVLADSEDVTADAALAAQLAEELEVPVLWVCTVDDAARVVWFGGDAPDPDEALGPAEVEAWADARIPGWRAGWADSGGERLAFGGLDADLYVDDAAWLVPTRVSVGAIQVRGGPGVDPTTVSREIAAYWLSCGARPGDTAVPEEPCGVIGGGSDRLVVAVSPCVEGWITVVDSEREVADLALADWLSATLDADVAWYWVDSENDAAALRLFGFEDLEEEPADEPESVIVFAAETFPQPFVTLGSEESEGWQRLGFTAVEADEYVTDPAWLEESSPGGSDPGSESG